MSVLMLPLSGWRMILLISRASPLGASGEGYEDNNNTMYINKLIYDSTETQESSRHGHILRRRPHGVPPASRGREHPAGQEDHWPLEFLQDKVGEGATDGGSPLRACRQPRPRGTDAGRPGPADQGHGDQDGRTAKRQTVG